MAAFIHGEVNWGERLPPVEANVRRMLGAVAHYPWSSTSIDLVGDAGLACAFGVGVEAKATVRIAGIKTRDTVRVSMWEPPRILVIDHLGWVKGSGEIQLQPVSEGTRMRWKETLFPPPRLGPIGRFGLAMARPLMRRIFRRDLRVLQSLVRIRSAGAS